MKKLLSAALMIALITAGAAQAQTTTPANNPSANSVQNEQSAPAAKADTQSGVKKSKVHKKKAVKTNSTKTGMGTSTDGTVSK